MEYYSKTLNINNNIIFKGYIKKVCDYYHMSDICVSSSRIEVLPFNIMEAISTVLPVIASNIKVHIDLIKNGYNGFLFEYNNIDEFCNYIKFLYNDRNLLNTMSITSNKLSKNYALETVLPDVVDVIMHEYNNR